MYQKIPIVKYVEHKRPSALMCLLICWTECIKKKNHPFTTIKLMSHTYCVTLMWNNAECFLALWSPAPIIFSLSSGHLEKHKQAWSRDKIEIIVALVLDYTLPKVREHSEPSCFMIHTAYRLSKWCRAFGIPQMKPAALLFWYAGCWFCSYWSSKALQWVIQVVRPAGFAAINPHHQTLGPLMFLMEDGDKYENEPSCSGTESVL